VTAVARLTLVPISVRDARAFIERVHRHHRAPQGAKFAVSVAQGSVIKGVCTAGRPVSRAFDDGWTIEITRVAVLEGVPNACSKLLSAAWRAARGMGYRRAVTYTLAEEGGGSLVAGGWRCVGEAGGGSWNRQSRPRTDPSPTQIKILWDKGESPGATPDSPAEWLVAGPDEELPREDQRDFFFMATR
jgi:hypothetical protein